jgi:hypothetical protein
MSMSALDNVVSDVAQLRQLILWLLGGATRPYLKRMRGFRFVLSEQDREDLEYLKVVMGVRSMAEVIRRLILEAAAKAEANESA